MALQDGMGNLVCMKHQVKMGIYSAADILTDFEKMSVMPFSRKVRPFLTFSVRKVRQSSVMPNFFR